MVSGASFPAGTFVDATIITAPCWTQDADDTPDPAM